jgi:hypothetical protein
MMQSKQGVLPAAPMPVAAALRDELPHTILHLRAAVQSVTLTMAPIVVQHCRL